MSALAHLLEKFSLAVDAHRHSQCIERKYRIRAWAFTSEVAAEMLKAYHRSGNWLGPVHHQTRVVRIGSLRRDIAGAVVRREVTRLVTLTVNLSIHYLMQPDEMHRALANLLNQLQVEDGIFLAQCFV